MPLALLASVLRAPGGGHVLEGNHLGVWGKRGETSLLTRSRVPCCLLRQNPGSLVTQTPSVREVWQTSEL